MTLMTFLVSSRELDDGTVEWRPLYEIRLKAGLGTELPCACISFSAPEHTAEESTSRILIAASHDGEVATADYARRERSSAAQMVR